MFINGKFIPKHLLLNDDGGASSGAGTGEGAGAVGNAEGTGGAQGGGQAQGGEQGVNTGAASQSTGGDDFDFGGVEIPDNLKPVINQIVSKRINDTKAKYEGEISPLKKQAQIVERLSKMVGITDLALLEARLNEYEEQQRLASIQQAAQQMGVNPALIKQMYDTQMASLSTQEELFNIKFDTQINALKTVSTYSDIDSVKELIKPLVKQGMPAEQAYWAVMGPKKASQVQREAEQRVVTNHLNNQGKGTIKDGGADTSTTRVTLTADEIEAAKSLGMDPLEYQAAKSYRNIEDFRKTKK